MRIDRIGFKAKWKYTGTVSYLINAQKLFLFRTEFEIAQAIINSLTLEEMSYLLDDSVTFTERKRLVKFIERKYAKFMKKENELNKIASKMALHQRSIRFSVFNKISNYSEN